MNRSDAYLGSLAVLRTADPAAKAAAAKTAALRSFDPTDLLDRPLPPARPARPDRPSLVPPGQVKRRRPGTLAGRIALLHALAHIEFNAIDLAFDMAVRFSQNVAREGLDGAAFFADWAKVGAEEAGHFLMLCDRLAAFDASYGDLPAHDGLWEAAAATMKDVLDRLAVAPLALEARGLDVTPAIIEKLRAAGDNESAEALEIIYRDEIGHVSIGVRWFEAIAARRGLDPKAAFENAVRNRLSGGLKPPFNDEARRAAGLSRDFYDFAERIRE